MVESRMDAVAGPFGNTPFPILARRTGRADLRHPALRLVSSCGTRRRNLNRERFRCGEFFSPSPHDTAFSEGSGSLSVLLGSSPITVTSPSSKAHQKSGSFAPLALPSFNAPTTLSDSRQSRRLSRR